jgi:hypothetical protein
MQCCRTAIFWKKSDAFYCIGLLTCNSLPDKCVQSRHCSTCIAITCLGFSKDNETDGEIRQQTGNETRQYGCYGAGAFKFLSVCAINGPRLLTRTLKMNNSDWWTSCDLRGRGGGHCKHTGQNSRSRVRHCHGRRVLIYGTFRAATKENKRTSMRHSN